MTFPFTSPFEPGPFYVVGPNNYKQPKDPKYFATADAADWLAKRYAGSVTEEPALSSGPYSVEDSAGVEVDQRTLVFVGNGRIVKKNAGLYASLFLEYPDAFDYVDGLIKEEVRAAIQE